MGSVDFAALLDTAIKHGASDIYLTVGTGPSLRVGDQVERISSEPLTEQDIQHFLSKLVSEHMLEEFQSTLEYNTAFNWHGRARFRINIFRQRQSTGIVMRRIQTQIPTLQSLGLPRTYGDIVMERRGLVLVVGPTGSGKSTSLASMLDYRNQNGSGHIVTVEDPIEFVLEHKGCIITQRDVGIDTYSFGIALKNALRQRPDVIVIGEIRDRDAMEQAIIFAETGHLCLATMHANNADQAIERVINFFPEEMHRQILLNLSLNLKAILSQRLLPKTNGGRAIALEIMLNKGLIKTLIYEGQVKELKEMIEKSRGEGMQTFDQSLFDLYTQGFITEETALHEADNHANLRLQITQHEMQRRSGGKKPAAQGPSRREY